VEDGEDAIEEVRERPLVRHVTALESDAHLDEVCAADGHFGDRCTCETGEFKRALVVEIALDKACPNVVLDRLLKSASSDLMAAALAKTSASIS
jgi:hypothetical protein